MQLLCTHSSFNFCYLCFWVLVPCRYRKNNYAAGHMSLEKRILHMSSRISLLTFLSQSQSSRTAHAASYSQQPIVLSAKIDTHAPRTSPEGSIYEPHFLQHGYAAHNRFQSRSNSLTCTQN